MGDIYISKGYQVLLVITLVVIVILVCLGGCITALNIGIHWGFGFLVIPIFGLMVIVAAITASGMGENMRR